MRRYQTKAYPYRSVKKSRSPILLIILLFFIVAVAFFVIRWVVTDGMPFKSGEITYDDSLTAEEKTFLEENLAEIWLSSDVTISAETVIGSAPDSDDTLVYNVLVPTTNFYDAASDVKSTDPNIDYLDIHQLQNTNKLLSLDGNYFFDDMTKGAKFRIFKFNGHNPSEVKNALFDKIDLPTQDSILSFIQTGVTALTRKMNEVLNVENDATYFSGEIADFLKRADYTHISNEVSFADDCSVTSSSTTLCADWRMLAVIEDIGADIVELTGNHNNDYGTENNLTTIKKYHELGLQTFGGGETEDAAKIPLQLEGKNTRITLLGYNQSTSAKSNGQGADGDAPGANIYDEALAAEDIKNAKERGGVIIVDVQYFECYSYPDEGEEYPTCDAPISGQQDFFRHLIDLGADVVIGTQAHQPQTYELYQNKPIYYGLGNLFFDQTYWPGTTRSLILTHYFWNGNLIQTRISPTVYDKTMQTKLMDEDASKWFLSRLAAARAI